MPVQRDALLKIMSRQDTDPFAMMFAVFAPIDFDVNVDARRGKVSAQGAA